MKYERIISMIVVCFFFFVGCSEKEVAKKNAVNNNYILYSLHWGEPWEFLKNNPQLKDVKIVVDDGNRFAVEKKDAEFLGIKGTMVLLFSPNEKSFPNVGFIKAMFSYDEEDEKNLIKAGEKTFGERKNFFLDENGVENPLNPAAWYCEETVEKSLTQDEKERYLKLLKENNVDDVRADAYIRGPLVVISVFENENYVEISGSNAAKVKNLKERRN